MINVFDFMFIVSWFGCIGIIGYKVYNLLQMYKENPFKQKNNEDLKPLYNLPMSIMLFVGYFVLYGLGFITVMATSALHKESMVLFSVMFGLQSWLVLFNVGIYFIEMLLNIASKPKKLMQAYKSNRG